MRGLENQNLALKGEFRVDQVPDEDTLQDVIENIRIDARDDPQNYLENAKVPKGGE